MTTTPDMYQRAYWSAQEVLDRALGASERDGAGEGMAAEVALLAQQRDEARAERDDFRSAALMYAATVDDLSQHLERANAQIERYGAIAETARALCLKASPGRELHIDGPTLRAEFRALHAAVTAEHARRHGHVALSIDADPPGAWADISGAASLLPTPPTVGSTDE